MKKDIDILEEQSKKLDVVLKKLQKHNLSKRERHDLSMERLRIIERIPIDFRH